jgi:PAS domain S-box-containing protein
MERHFRSRKGLAFSHKIGDTLTDVPTTTQADRERQPSPATTLRLDAAFVNALYNGLTEAILAVQFGTRKIVHWNRGAEAMFGYAADEVLGKTTEVIYPGQHSFERISQLATPAIREHGAWQTEWEYRRRDGSHFPADVVATMIEGLEGSQFYVIVIRDVSARKRAEAAFKEQSAYLLKIRQRLQAVLDNTPMLIYVAGSDGKLGLINKRFEELFHVRAAGILATPLHAVFDHQTAAALLENNAKVMAAKTTMEFEEIIPQADGLRTYLSVKVPLYDEAGVLYAVCAMSTDITERKRDHETIQKMNEELESRVAKRTAQLEAINNQLRQEILNRRQAEEKLLESERMATIGVTTAKLVHEIANPLQTMITAVELLDECLAESPMTRLDVCQSMVSEMGAQIKLLGNLLAEFKDVARPMKLEIRPVDPVLLIREVLLAEASHYAKLGIHIEEQLPDQLPLIDGDPVKLKQLLLNLFRNAAEAMPNGGTLSVRADQHNPELTIEVADTGTGIPEGMNVFELFKTSKPMGTGLGLAIVRDIVSAHQGVISYSSRPEEGTTFQVRLPLAARTR